MPPSPSPSRRGRTVGEVVRFLVIGGTCYLAGLLTIVALVKGLGVHYLLANVLAVAVVYPLGYLLNRRFNFRSVRSVWSEMPRYYAANGAMLGASLALIGVLVEVGHVHYVAANAIATVLQTIANFMLAKWWVFTGRDPQSTRS